MTAIIGWLLSNPIVIAIGGGLIAALVAFLKGRSAGAQKERAKQAAKEQKARDVADEVDNDIGAMPPDKARKELSKW